VALHVKQKNNSSWDISHLAVYPKLISKERLSSGKPSGERSDPEFFHAANSIASQISGSDWSVERTRRSFLVVKMLAGIF
jgi:hypothetical protein